MCVYVVQELFLYLEKNNHMSSSNSSIRST